MIGLLWVATFSSIARNRASNSSASIARRRFSSMPASASPSCTLRRPSATCFSTDCHAGPRSTVVFISGSWNRLLDGAYRQQSIHAQSQRRRIRLQGEHLALLNDSLPVSFHGLGKYCPLVTATAGSAPSHLIALLKQSPLSRHAVLSRCLKQLLLSHGCEAPPITLPVRLSARVRLPALHYDVDKPRFQLHQSCLT